MRSNTSTNHDNNTLRLFACQLHTVHSRNQGKGTSSSTEEIYSIQTATDSFCRIEDERRLQRTQIFKDIISIRTTRTHRGTLSKVNGYHVVASIARVAILVIHLQLCLGKQQNSSVLKIAHCGHGRVCGASHHLAQHIARQDERDAIGSNL
jgi:hypothetical protein